MQLRRTPQRVATFLAALFVSVGLLVPPASAATPRCFGERATIVGTSRDDVIRGTGRSDVIVARGGDDTIRGRGRGDLICAGAGDDAVFGGGGVDLTFGGSGDDEIFGQGGNFNQAVPGPGDDVVDGGTGPGGNEVIYLDAGGPITGDLGTGIITGHGTDEVTNIQWLIGGPFDDVLTGTDGFDLLYGAGGNDMLAGLGGEFDVVSGGEGDDVMDGGAGPDFNDAFGLSFNYIGAPPTGPFNVNLVTGTATGEGTDTLIDMEGSSGSLGDDVMVGDAEDNEFTGLRDGNDTVDAGDGDDLVDGGDGVDDLDGGAGVDLLGNLDASAGMTIDLSTQTDSHGDTLAGFEDVFGTFFNDTITGDDGINFLFGIDGNDVLSGLGGDDLLIGDAGTDTADGGLGSDQCDAETETNCEADPPPALARSSRSAYGWKAKTG